MVCKHLHLPCFGVQENSKPRLNRNVPVVFWRGSSPPSPSWPQSPKSAPSRPLWRRSFYRTYAARVSIGMPLMMITPFWITFTYKCHLYGVFIVYFSSSHVCAIHFMHACLLVRLRFCRVKKEMFRPFYDQLTKACKRGAPRLDPPYDVAVEPHMLYVSD